MNKLRDIQSMSQVQVLLRDIINRNCVSDSGKVTKKWKVSTDDHSQVVKSNR